MSSQPQPGFLLIVQLHHLQAMLQLGAIVNPLTGKANPPNLDKARHELALLDILREKTAGNLTDEEDDILSRAISSINEAIDASFGDD
ncbi:DUF1844 domain-containing protein [Candidatus Sumerlaeota bacterium]|nr:DUF1844 domain-containing protein [Candidatus Sumerlaeota bacterium]